MTRYFTAIKDITSEVTGEVLIKEGTICKEITPGYTDGQNEVTVETATVTTIAILGEEVKLLTAEEASQWILDHAATYTRGRQMLLKAIKQQLNEREIK